MAAQTVEVKKLAPERRRQPVVQMNCGCTCCCCCCCLHSAGSLLGAAVAPVFTLSSPLSVAYYVDEDTGETRPISLKPGLSAVAFYWWLQIALLFFAIVALSLPGIFSAADGNQFGGSLLAGPFITFCIYALFLPIIQLFGVVVTGFVYLCWPRLDKWQQLFQLAKITIGIIVGTILGIGAMVLLVVGYLFLHS